MAPKRKPQNNSTHKAIKGLLVIFSVFIMVWGYLFLFPRDIPNGSYKLVVARGDSLSKVARKLDNANVIPDAKLMIAMARVMGKDRKITAGMYLFNKPMSIFDMIERLSSGKPDEISFTILEGWNFTQLRKALYAESQIAHYTESMSDAQIRSALKITNPRVEGLFYPDTYFVAPLQSDIEILQIANKKLQIQLAKVWQARNESNTSYKNSYELLTMASLIQKETSESQDMVMVSTVFNNRLRINMRLQDDPAVFYGLGNKANITRADFAIDTPYNTYLHSGLPPTPICIPSANALNAAANPTSDRQILYFVAIGNGKTKFSQTYSEHTQAVNKYLKSK